MTGVGEPIGVLTYSKSGEIKFLGENVSQFGRAARPWDQRLEIARKRRKRRECVCVWGDPEDVMEAQRSRGAEEGAIVQRESKTPSLGVRELQNWEPEREARVLSQ